MNNKTQPIKLGVIKVKPHSAEALWGLCSRLSNACSLSRTTGTCATATEGRPCAEQKAEVIPPAVVVDFVNAYVIRKQRDDKRDRADQAVPEATPETGYVADFVSRMDRGIVSRSATGHEDGDADQHQSEQNALFHVLILSWFGFEGVGPEWLT